jgi:hypothetical protein
MLMIKKIIPLRVMVTLCLSSGGYITNGRSLSLLLLLLLLHYHSGSSEVKVKEVIMVKREACPKWRSRRVKKQKYDEDKRQVKQERAEQVKPKPSAKSDEVVSNSSRHECQEKGEEVQASEVELCRYR